MRVFVHAPYLVNLGSPTPATYERSVATVAHNLGGPRRSAPRAWSCTPARAWTDGGIVRRRAAAGPRGAAAVLETLTRGDEGPWLLLEPTAGQGRSLCAGVDDLEPYLAALDHHPRAGICLDTCHVFAAGAPLDEPGGTTATVDRIVEIGGPGRLRLVHANDSMDVRGAFKDRHERIGQGHIGIGAFAELLAHDATAGVPFVLETPGSRDPGRRRHRAAKKLRAAVRAHPADDAHAAATQRCSRPWRCWR